MKDVKSLMSQYLIDTLYFVRKNTDLETVLNNDFPYDIPFSAGNGMYGYDHALFYNGIRVLYNSTVTLNKQNKDWIYIILSGKGCRTLEDFHFNKYGMDYPWDNLIKDLSQDHFNNDVRRIDIAFDYTSKGTPSVPYLIRLYLSNRVATRYSNVRYIQGSEECIYFGSPKSDCMLRIYNKQLERGYKAYDSDSLAQFPFGRTRFEFQLRDFAAYRCVDNIALNGLLYAFNDLINERVRFLSKSRFSDNVTRISNCAWYDRQFSLRSDKYVIPSPRGGYNREKLSRYIDQCRSSMLVWAQTEFTESFDFNNWLYSSDLRPDQIDYLSNNKKLKY